MSREPEHIPAQHGIPRDIGGRKVLVIGISCREDDRQAAKGENGAQAANSSRRHDRLGIEEHDDDLNDNEAGQADGSQCKRALLKAN